jgi:N-acyl-L-homoserine lactone synthetase
LDLPEYTSKQSTMITLRQITDPQELEVYYRFRYKVYANSRQQAFVQETDGTDRDEYDADAVHLGWYVNGKLRGCVRFIRPIGGNDPLYCFTHMPPEVDAPVRALMQGYLDQGKPFVEVSRICIDPGYRDLATVKKFVLATMAMSHVLKLDQAVFACDRSHVPFWVRMGFALMRSSSASPSLKAAQPSHFMLYSYADLPERILAELPAYTLALTDLTAVAA